MTATTQTPAAPAAASRMLDFLKQPLVVALILIVALLLLGEALSPGFASAQQILRLLIVAALLGIVAAGQNLVILGGREGIDLSVGGVISLQRHHRRQRHERRRQRHPAGGRSPAWPQAL